tara:strand:+ start:73 stop:495 length:423 start_codon:yes stop_codon:yes gene_type:complete
MGFDLQGKNPKMHTDEPPEGCHFDDYSQWLNENPGVYFRNNVWWWRATWDYICDKCSDILSQKDVQGGNYNDGHYISGAKSLQIARRLDKLIKRGEVHAYELAYAEWKDNQSEEVPYPFYEENVKRFSLFARESGGFYIC